MDIQRIKSIDIFRGLCMAWMVLNHIINWWINSEYSWLHSIAIMIIDPIGASGFLFISGVSVTLSYRKRMDRAKVSEDYNCRIIRNSYLFRAFFLFIIALIYNIPVAVVFKNPFMIWYWFILLTAAVSLFLAWPLLKTPNYFRIFVTIAILVLHFSLISWLPTFQGDSNIFGVLFHILYNGITQDPILIFFPFFLIGTVIGNFLYDAINLNHKNNQKLIKLLILMLIMGISLILTGILLKYPNFVKRESLSWVVYSFGIEIALLSVLILLENLNLLKAKRSYKLIFYYSYYSLTIYLVHNLVYFLFLNQLNLINIWFSAIATFLSIGFIFRMIYKRWEAKASLKAQITRISLNITMRIENKLYQKYSKKSH
ncbi:MAG: heparan-alpha-glucosaminide N-acetyltransferase domain-containing protein [Promethearchaeota archaeon]